MLKKELERELNRTKLILDYAREENKEKDKEIEELKEKNKKSNDIIKKIKRELLDKKNIVEKSKYFKLVYTDEEMEHIWDKTIINKMDEIIETLKGGE